MFWWGVLVGLLLGGTGGMVAAALFFAKRVPPVEVDEQGDI